MQIAIPKLGVTMVEGVLAEWLASDGSQVSAGQPLYIIETDKTESEIEAPVSGVLRVIGVAGETYQVGDVIGSID